MEYYVAVQYDTTRRRNAEDFNRTLLRSAGEAMIAVDSNGLITHFNAMAEELLGYDAQEVIGSQTLVIFHDEKEIIAAAKQLSQELGQQVEPGMDVFFKGAEQSGAVYRRKWTYIRRDGTRFPVILSINVVRQPDGVVLGYFGVVRDLSLEAEHEVLTERLRLASQGAKIGIWDFEPQTGSLVWDQQMHALYGTDPDSVEGIYNDWRSCLDPRDLERAEVAVQRAIDGVEPYDLEFRIVRKGDGAKALDSWHGRGFA